MTPNIASVSDMPRGLVFYQCSTWAGDNARALHMLSLVRVKLKPVHEAQLAH